MDVFIFYCPYCGKFSEKQVCSHCRNALYTRTGLFVKNNTGHSYFPRELKEKMTAKLLDELKKRAQKSKTKALAFVEKESETTKKSDAEYDAKAITADSKTLSSYFRALVKTESRVYELSNIYSEVCLQLDSALLIRDYDSKVIIQELDKKSKKKSQPEDPEKIKNKILELVDKELKKDGIVEPKSPKKPAMHSKKVTIPPVPVEPIYEKPGLFNKKRVEQRNKAAATAYQEQLTNYRKMCAQAEQYQKALAEFNAAMEQYRKDKAEYDQSYSDYIQARNNTEEKVKADLEAKKRKKELAEQEKATRFADERNQLRNEALKSFPNQKKIDFLEEQKKVLKTELAETIAIRRSLLNSDVIYQKYRTIVAEACMLEYLDSGRCKTLTGDNGAYNLYESEIRAGIINPILDQLLLSIETVKVSKSVLFVELSEISRYIKDVSDKLQKVLKTFNTKTTNTSFAKKWITEKSKGEYKEEPISETTQVKIDTFTNTLKKYRKKKTEELKKLIEAVPKK